MSPISGAMAGLARAMDRPAERAECLAEMLRSVLTPGWNENKRYGFQGCPGRPGSAAPMGLRLQRYLMWANLICANLLCAHLLCAHFLYT